MVELTAAAKRLLEGRNFGHLATLMPDGSPQVSPVWVDHDGEYVLVNTALGRVKQRNTVRDPRVALSIHDQSEPYTKVLIRGRVVKQVTEGAWAHINQLSHKYTGKDYPRYPGQTRVILTIKPEHITD